MTTVKKLLIFLTAIATLLALFGCARRAQEPAELFVVAKAADVKGISHITQTIAERHWSFASRFFPSVHSHQWESSVVEPTCTQRGYTQRLCRTCGSRTTGSYVRATGHSWNEWVTVTPATSTARGERIRTCTGCGMTQKQTVRKLPVFHTHQYQSRITAMASCSEPGEITYTCSCGHSCKEQTPVTNHVWHDWKVTLEETETSTGLKERSCMNCDAVETETIPVREHTHSMKHIRKNPSCTEDGYTLHQCCRCDYTYTDSTVPAMGHNWGEWFTAMEPTQEMEGTAQRTCSNCSDVDTKILEKLHIHSHTEILERKDATCEQDGYIKKACACGDVITETFSDGHNWTVHHTDEEGHYVPRITCHCGWSCSAEGDYISAYAEHLRTVSSDDRGNHSYYTGRIWVVDTPAGSWRVCSNCGKTENPENVEHIHNYSPSILAEPGCTTTGIRNYFCSCGKNVTEPIPETGHTWSDWLTVEEPTTEKEGRAERTCSVCGKTESDTLDKISQVHTHSHTDVLNQVEATCEQDGYLEKACACGDVITETISAPGHTWAQKHSDEEGHYVPRITCHCGWSCSAEGDYISAYALHMDSLPENEKWTHSYYEGREWVTDVPARDWNECSVCGITG